MQKVALLIGGCGIAFGADRSGIPVNDCHVHSIKDQSRVKYGYTGLNPGGPWFHMNYSFEEYQRAVSGTVLEPDSHMFMSLYNTPQDQYIPQAVLAYDLQKKQLSPTMAGVVANVDFTSDQVGQYLDDLMSEVPAVKGLRAYYSGDGPFSAAFLLGAKEAETRGLTVEILQARPAQLSELYALAVTIPNTSFVINHMGLKGIPDDDGAVLPNFTEWKVEMTKLASLSNVYVKISGGAAPRGDNAVDTMRPFVRHLVDVFTYERTIFAGNWFAVEGSLGFFSYSKWADAVELYLTEMGATRTQRSWMLHKGCETAYKLNGSTSTHTGGSTTDSTSVVSHAWSGSWSSGFLFFLSPFVLLVV